MNDLTHRLGTALEMARTGLLWYHENIPGFPDGSDDEALAEIDAALAEYEQAQKS